MPLDAQASHVRKLQSKGLSHIFRSFTIIVFNEAYVLWMVNLLRLGVGMKVGSAVASRGQYRMRRHDDLSQFMVHRNYLDRTNVAAIYEARKTRTSAILSK